ncbi:prephenate dehydratase [Lachnoanaerobaculum gingivalis]|uniref:Prephenate dehydratase n=1 Tax=Lachnoanaerobaculum gingivalis TaxID=2490855 RepID=A0A3P3QXD5_9FIRM|nr:prephenate dehydratase [Lachnoanaerobaculum gingivalis]RRJ25896.1 prephenate dehydratase [Lachnoanaerobaculum gingivalis]
MQRLEEIKFDDMPSGFKCKEYMDSDIKKIVYQGVEGAYSHIVTQTLFPDADTENVNTFEDAINSVLNGEASYCVVPIENSSAGIVTDIFDLLLKKDVVIVAEYDLHISHCLLGIKGASFFDIKIVYSHPQALMQCASYLKEHPEWSQISLLNTAVSAKKVKNEGKIEQAAIASELSAKLYGLNILDRGINRNSNNTTRFVVLSKEKIFSKASNKLSLILELPHEKGMLYNILGIFVLNGLNLLKIESRPIAEKTFEYRFFIDIEANLNSANVSNVLEILKNKVPFLKILGNYCSNN